MQFANGYPDTYKHALFSWAGSFYVPPHHLQVVCRDGVFQGYLENGYHWPQRWRMTYPQLINLNVRKYRFTLDKIRALDGGSFTAELVVKVQFDPRTIESETVRAKLSILPEEVIRSIVLDELEEALRQAFSEYPAHTLTHGSMRNILQRRCRHLLMNPLEKFGVAVRGVLITTIMAPESVEKRSNDAVSRVIAAEYLRDIPQSEFVHLLLAQIPDILQASDLSLRLGDDSELSDQMKKFLRRLVAVDKKGRGSTQTGSHSTVH